MQEIVKKIEDNFHKEVMAVFDKYNKKLNEAADYEMSSKVYKPKVGEKYYQSDEWGRISYETWSDDACDNSAYEIGNVFKTEAHAELELEKLKIWTKLKRYSEEHNPVPLDWDDEKQEKHNVYIDEDGYIETESVWVGRYSPLQIFTSRQVCLDAIEHIGGIEKLRLLLEQ